MDIASGALYRLEENNAVGNEALYMKEEAIAVKDNFESVQLSKRQKKKLRKSEQAHEKYDIATKGKPYDHQEPPNDENELMNYFNELQKLQLENVLAVEPNNQPLNVSDKERPMNVSEEEKLQKLQLENVFAVEPNNQPLNVSDKERPMDVSEEENQDNQETMNMEPVPQAGYSGNKRGFENENDSTKKRKTVDKKYPKGSKLKYYDRFRRQIRHQQRLRSYMHLYRGTPTIMAETYSWTLKNYPREDLKLKESLENEMKTDTWKLVMLENNPKEQNLLQETME